MMANPTDPMSSNAIRGRSSTRTSATRSRRSTRRASAQCEPISRRESLSASSSGTATDVPRSLSPNSRTSKHAVVNMKREYDTVRRRFSNRSNDSIAPRSLSPRARTSIYAIKVINAHNKHLVLGNGLGESAEDVQTQGTNKNLGSKCFKSGSIVKVYRDQKSITESELNNSSNTSSTWDNSTCSSLSASLTHNVSQVDNKPCNIKIPKYFTIPVDKSSTGLDQVNIGNVTPSDTRMDYEECTSEPVASSPKDPPGRNKTSHASPTGRRHNAVKHTVIIESKDSDLYKAKHTPRISRRNSLGRNRTDKNSKICWKPFVNVSTGELAMNSFYRWD